MGSGSTWSGRWPSCRPASAPASSLRHYADCSEQETAELLGVSVGTVKSQTAKGLAMLFKELGMKPAGEEGGRA